MQDDYNKFAKRKQDHIALALMQDNQAEECNVLDSILLEHEALPDLDFNSITIASSRLRKTVAKPFLVSSMTAGHCDAIKINRNLIAAASENSWAMGVGSQRRELFDPKACLEWKDLRRNFADVELFSNLGISQLINTSVNQIKRLTEVLSAQALIIHCNALQEVIQPEGTPEFKGCWDVLANLTKTLGLPVIVKETGCGFSKKTLSRLNDIGIAAVDVSGLGGTHWGRIEGKRAAAGSIKQQVAHTFRSWGINTVSSIQNAVSLNPNFEIWGSGGVRSGLDAARLFALGATTVGFAKPMLEAGLKTAECVSAKMALIEYELKVAMFCTGSHKLTDLKERLCR